MENNNLSYDGNSNLKKPGVAFQFTLEQIEEYTKCAGDAHYFTKFIKIVHLDKGVISFVPYTYQTKIIDTVTQNRFTICKLPRQSGKTTVMAALILWYALFTPNFTIAILANKGEQSQEILDRIKLAYEFIPIWMQQGIVKWNERSIELENGSKIITAATSADTIRGRSLNLVYLDEFAHVHANLQEEFFTSVYPTITAGTQTKVIITSTPKGMNLFYKIWTDSEHDRNTYKRIDIHWSETPGRDEAWAIETKKNMGEEKFSQEFDTEFLGSSNTLIHPSKLRKLIYIEPINHDEFLRIYEPPQEKHVYVCVVDTSRGGGGDYSAFLVIDVTQFPFKLVATYRNNLITSLLYPSIIFQVATHFNKAWVLVETNDIGQQIADILYLDMEYENLLHSHSSGRAGQVLGLGPTSNYNRGVKTSTPVKKTGCAVFKSLIENDKLIIEDYNMIFEMFRFVQKGSSFEADEGSDDLMMCGVLFGWLANQPAFKDLIDQDVRKGVQKENLRNIEASLMPFGIKVDPLEGMPLPEDEIKTVPNLEKWFHDENV